MTSNCQMKDLMHLRMWPGPSNKVLYHLVEYSMIRTWLDSDAMFSHHVARFYAYSHIFLIIPSSLLLRPTNCSKLKSALHTTSEVTRVRHRTDPFSKPQSWVRLLRFLQVGMTNWLQAVNSNRILRTPTLYHCATPFLQGTKPSTRWSVHLSTCNAFYKEQYRNKIIGFNSCARIRVLR